MVADKIQIRGVAAIYKLPTAILACADTGHVGRALELLRDMKTLAV